MKAFVCSVLLFAMGCMGEPLHIGSDEQESSATPPAIGWGDSSVVSTIGADGSVSWCCTAWHTPIAAAVGERIASVNATVRDNGLANGVVIGGNQVALVLEARTTTSTALLGSAVSNGSGSSQVLTVTPAAAHVVLPGEEIVLKALAFTTTGTVTLPSSIRSVNADSHRTIVRTFWPKVIVGGNGIFAPPVVPKIGVDGSVAVESSNDEAIGILEIPSEVGDTIVSLTMSVAGNGVADGSVAVNYARGAASLSGGADSLLLGGFTDLDRSSTWTSLTLPLTPQLIDSDGYLKLTVHGTKAGYRWGEMRATFTR